MKVKYQEKIENNQNSSKKSLKILEDEAILYFNLVKDYKRDNCLTDELEIYLLEKNFLIKWKKYVNYSLVKNRVKNSSNIESFINNNELNSHHENPGPINNRNLLVSFSNFHNDGDEENSENIVIRKDLDKNDFIKINHSIWLFFHLRYGGGPIIKKNAIPEISKKEYEYPKMVIELYDRKVNP